MKQKRILEIDTCERCYNFDFRASFCMRMQISIKDSKVIPRECTLLIFQEMPMTNNYEDSFQKLRSSLLDAVNSRIKFMKLRDLEDLEISAGSVYRIKTRAKGLKTRNLIKVLRKLEQNAE